LAITHPSVDSDPELPALKPKAIGSRWRFFRLHLSDSLFLIMGSWFGKDWQQKSTRKNDSHYSPFRPKSCRAKFHPKFHKFHPKNPNTTDKNKSDHSGQNNRI
jgi:hypothetical protein